VMMVSRRNVTTDKTVIKTTNRSTSSQIDPVIEFLPGVAARVRRGDGIWAVGGLGAFA